MQLYRAGRATGVLVWNIERCRIPRRAISYLHIAKSLHENARCLFLHELQHNNESPVTNTRGKG